MTYKTLVVSPCSSPHHGLPGIGHLERAILRGDALGVQTLVDEQRDARAVLQRRCCGTDIFHGI